MFITNLTQVGEIYLLLSKGWEQGGTKITIKHDGEKPFDNVVVDSIQTVNEIYKYLLENWVDRKVQIFITE